MKVGLLGGTFNPPHLGHLRLAEEVADIHQLDRVVFIPSFTPPHKGNKDIAPSIHRLEMTRRACADNFRFEVSELEISRQGPSYTVNTLEIFSAELDTETFFILGTDSLREISTWKEHERLFTLSHFIVVKRPPIDFEDAWAEIPAELRNRFAWRNGRLEHSSGRVVVGSPVCGLDVSSTRIRAMVRDEQSIRYLVTESVRSYIKDNHLYGR